MTNSQSVRKILYGSSMTTGKHKGMYEHTDIHPNNEILCTGIKNENILLWNNLQNVFGARNWRISTQYFV